MRRKGCRPPARGSGAGPPPRGRPAATPRWPARVRPPSTPSCSCAASTRSPSSPGCPPGCAGAGAGPIPSCRCPGCTGGTSWPGPGTPARRRPRASRPRRAPGPGRSRRGWVLYERHAGTFPPEGTLDAAVGRLDHLRQLGVHTVELMPVAAFPGRHGWGYDGINLWAVHEPYGGPDGLKRFVDACHARGLAVILDVVYNHVAVGNRLGDFWPSFTPPPLPPAAPPPNL